MSITSEFVVTKTTVASTSDGVCALIVQGVAVASGGGYAGIALNEPKLVRSLDDAETLGLTAAYDETNGILVHYHIRKYFEMKPKGELWIVLSSQADDWRDITDVDGSYWKKLVLTAQGTVRMVGVAFNPLSNQSFTITNTFDQMLYNAIANAQVAVQWAAGENMPIAAVFMEGREFTGTVAAAQDLRTLNVGNISVVAFADHTTTFRSALATNYNNNSHVLNHAAVGVVLGAASNRSVNTSIAYNSEAEWLYGIMSATEFLNVGLSNNNAPATYTPSQLQDLDNLGYIVACRDPDAPGTYIKGDPTCTDANLTNAYVNLNRTAVKVTKSIRQALFHSQSMVIIFKKGKIDDNAATELKQKGGNPLKQMMQKGEISDFEISIDATQDILGTGELEILYDVTPTGTGRILRNKVVFVNPSN